MLKFREIGVFLKKPSRDPVRTQSGPSRDPIRHQFLHFWAPLLASRDPVGIQSGSSRAPILEVLAPRLDLSGSSQNHRKTRKNTAKMLFCCEFGCLPTLVPDWIPTGSRLDPDWIPTGSRLAKSGAQKSKKSHPDEIPTESINWQEPTPAPIFPFPDPPLPLFSFSAHQPCINTLPPSCTKTAKAVLSQTGVLQYIYIYIYLYLSIYLSIYLPIYLSISISIYLYLYLSIFLCSRIELKMSKTKHKQLQQTGGTFAMQLACAAGFLSDAKRINHKTGFI